MSKKVTSVIILVVLLVSIVTSVFASPMMLFAVIENKIGASISISNGNVTVEGTVIKTAPGNSTELTVTLQKKSGNRWTNVKTGTGSSYASTSDTAVKGETYRAYVKCTINGTDTITKTSGSKTY